MFRRTLPLLLIACALSAQTRGIDDFFRDFTDQWMRLHPSQATSTRYFTGEERDRLARDLTPRTDAHRRARIQLARAGLARLANFDPGQMTETQRVSADLMRWQLDIIAREEPFLDYMFPLEQMTGVNATLPEQLAVRYPLASEKDAANYLAALSQVSARMREATADARRLAAKGVVPPRFILAATIKQMQSFNDPSPGQNVLVTSYARRMGTIAGLAGARREELRAAAEKIVAGQVYPAWREAVQTLQAQLPSANDEAGLWRLQGGGEAYAYFLRRYTTTDLTADQIHEIGLREVARIEGEMDAIFRRLGRAEGSLKERIAKLENDLSYPPTEDGRGRIMADVNGYLRDAQRRSELLFDETPKSPVIAQPFPRFLEANAAANYNPPTPDGSRPGTFQIPLRPERMTKFGLRSLVYHETVPGHHFQVALQVENKDLPRFRQSYALGVISAMAEGWGLYAERLAAESGWYEGDLEGLLGQLDSALFRARRLVVDTGLHAKHWTRQQAIDYGIEASEVERYVVWPGQACSYMIGQLKIVELREKTRKALGDKFSLREFHNVILRTGMVPLETLERQVDAWMQDRLTRKP